MMGVGVLIRVWADGLPITWEVVALIVVLAAIVTLPIFGLMTACALLTALSEHQKKLRWFAGLREADARAWVYEESDPPMKRIVRGIKRSTGTGRRPDPQKAFTNQQKH
jgi:hypothetical protein